MASTTYAQDIDTVNHIIYRTVPAKMNIKDKIIVANTSPYTLLQVMIAQPNEDGTFTPISATSYLGPNEVWTACEAEDNGLKKLRGMTLAIKVKGTSKSFGKDKVYTSKGHKVLDPKIVNQLTPDEITYNFDVTLAEADHDLYVNIFYAGSSSKSVMDF